MRSLRARILTVVVGLGLATAVVSPALGAATPVVRLSLSGIACNPGGQPGLQSTASATVSGTAVKWAQLVVFEFQPISDPVFAPFTWTGGSVATWISEDGFRTAVPSDSRTLATTDPHTWNRGNYSKDVWLGSKSDSWWLVDYNITTTTRNANQQHVGWYVSCPTGRIVDQASLHEIVQVTTTGLR